MDNWNEEIDLEAILREYGGEQGVTFPEPEADAAEAAEPKFEFPHEIGERGEPDFDAFNLSFDTEPEDDVRVYSPSPAADAEDEDDVRIYCPGSGAKSFAASADTDAEEIEFDPRFNLGGKKKDTELSFNGKSIDLSADYDYAPPLPHDADFVSAYAGADSAEEPEEEAPRGFFRRLVDKLDQASLGKPRIKRRRRTDDAFAAAATVYDLSEDQYERRASAYEAAESEQEYEDDAYEPEEPAYEAVYQPQYGEADEAADEYEDDAPAETDYAPPEETPWQEPEFDFAKYDEPQPEPESTQPPEERSPYEFDSFNAFDPAGAHRTDDDGYAEGFVDYDLGDDYAEKIDYERPESEFREKEDFFPSSFKEYIFSVITTLLYRLRGGRGSSLTMEDEPEELGAEVSPLNASKYYASFTNSLRLRLRVSLIMLVVMIWITVGLPVPGMLKDYKCASAALLAMQLTVSLLALDVVTTGIMNLVRGKPGAETLAVFSCFLTGADALVVSLGNISSPHVSLCCISTLSLIGALASSLISCRGMRKALRVPAIGRRAYTVTGEMDVKAHEITLLKSLRPFSGFVHRTEEAAPDEEIFQKAALPLMFAALLLAIIVAAVKKSFGDLIFIYSAIFAPGVPIAALLCFALPFLLGSLRIFSSGAAIAGWSGLSDIGRSKNLIVTDRDLFPEGSVELENVRIFADGDPERIISFAGSMICAAGCSVSEVFGKLMEDNGYTTCRIDNFEYLSGGGMKGIIDGSVVICGSTELMRLMNVRVPYRLVGKTSVLLAIDGVLYGIFNVKYTPLPQVRQALINLIRSDRHPIFAIRDFNINPEMLAKTFDIATDGYDFPPYVERFKISAAAPGEDSKIAAVVCREGLGPLTHVAETGRKMYLAVRANLAVTLASSLLGLLLVFIKLISTGTVSPVFLLVYMLLSAVPVAVISVAEG